MAVNSVSREMMKIVTEEEIRRYHADIRYHVLPLSLLMLAFVTIAGMAFFRSDFWLLGALFIAGGFLIVSSLIHMASRRMPAHPVAASRKKHAKRLGAGTVSTAAGVIAMFAVMGEAGVQLGAFKVFIAQVGFALVVMGAFWLAMTLRDLI